MRDRDRRMIDAYYRHESLQQVAEELDTTLAYVKTRITLLRKRHQLPVRKSTQQKAMDAFRADQATVIQQYREHGNASRLAHQYGITVTAVITQLKSWGEIPVIRGNQQSTITLADLHRNWIDITDACVITVNGIPRFTLTPIERGTPHGS